MQARISDNRSDDAPSADATALLSRVSVASPCHASWDEMHGGDRVRSCDHCQKKVYNLSEMTADEAAALVRDAEGAGRPMCVRFYRRADGTMLTRDCPVGLSRVRKRAARAVAAVFGSALVTGGALTHLLDRRDTMGSPTVERPVSVQPLMGAVAPTTPDPTPTPEPYVEMGEASVEPIQGKMIQGRSRIDREPVNGRMVVLPMASAETKSVQDELGEIRAAR